MMSAWLELSQQGGKGTAKGRKGDGEKAHTNQCVLVALLLAALITHEAVEGNCVVPSGTPRDPLKHDIGAEFPGYVGCAVGCVLPVPERWFYEIAVAFREKDEDDDGHGVKVE